MSFFSKLLFFTCLFSATVGFGQEKRMEGYYIRPNGDTIKGIVHYRQWQHNPGVIVFEKDGGVTSLKPGDVREIHINGEDTYISYNGTRLSNPVNLRGDDRQVDSVSKFDTAAVFLRLLHTGADTRLLVFENSARANFYLQEDTVVTELIYKAYMAEDRVSYLPLYKQQLLVRFEKEVFSKDLLKVLNSLRYKEEDLVAFMEKINGSAPVKKKRAYPGKLILEAGISVNHIEKRNTPAYPEANADYRNSVSPVLGVAYIFYTRRNFGKLFFSPQLKVYSYNNTGPSKTTSGSPLTTTVKSGIMLNLLVNAGFNAVNRQQLKWGIMINGGLLVATKEELLLENPSGTSGDIYFTKKGMKYTIGLQTRVLLKNKISGFASYSLPSSVSYFYGKYSSVQIGGGLAL